MFWKKSGMEDKIMFCQKCGMEISDTASFCSNCGAQIKKITPTQIVKEEEYSDEIYLSMKEYLEKDNVHYDEFITKGVLVARYAMPPNKSTVKTIVVLYKAYTTGSSLKFVIVGISAQESNYNNLGALLSYINSVIRYGRFQLDPRDGEVSFSFDNICNASTVLDYDTLDLYVRIGLTTVAQHADILVSFMLGYLNDSREAFDKILQQ